NGAWHDVELVVPNQQESLDQFIRSLYRRNGLPDAGDDHVDRRLRRRQVVDEAVGGVRSESDRRLRWIRRDGPLDLHALARHVSGQVRRDSGRDLSVGVSYLAAAEGRVAGVRDLVRVAVVRHSPDSLPPEDRSKSLRAAAEAS